jgi:hypothetical protein
MKIYNSNIKHQYISILLGMFWLIIAWMDYETKDKIDWSFYGKIIIGLFYILITIYEYYYKYIEFSNDIIYRNSIPKLKIVVSDLIEVNYFAGDYIFKSKNKRIDIVKNQINTIQLKEFEDRFNLLKMKVEENLS